MEKYKKANELDITLRNLEKLANIPLRGVVAGNFASRKPNKTAKVLPRRKKLSVRNYLKSSKFRVSKINNSQNFDEIDLKSST